MNTQAEGPRPATTDIRTGRISDDDAAVGFWGNSTHRARWARVRDSLTGDRAGTEGTASRKIDAEVRVHSRGDKIYVLAALNINVIGDAVLRASAPSPIVSKVDG